MRIPEFHGIPEVSGKSTICSKIRQKPASDVSCDCAMMHFDNSDPKALILMWIKLSNENLDEANWGLLKWYNEWDCSGIGKIHNASKKAGNHVNLSFFHAFQSIVNKKVTMQ